FSRRCRLRPICDACCRSAQITPRRRVGSSTSSRIISRPMWRSRPCGRSLRGGASPKLLRTTTRRRCSVSTTRIEDCRVKPGNDERKGRLKPGEDCVRQIEKHAAAQERKQRRQGYIQLCAGTRVRAFAVDLFSGYEQ